MRDELLTPLQLRRRRAATRRRLLRQRRAALTVVLTVIALASAAGASAFSQRAPHFNSAKAAAPLRVKVQQAIAHLRIVQPQEQTAAEATTAVTTNNTPAPQPPAPQSGSFLCPYPSTLRDAFTYASTVSGLSRALLAAVAHTESRFHQGSVSGVGAVGVMQLMPATARSLQVDRSNVWENIVGGARYLQSLYHRFGSEQLALAAYNAGPSAVSRYGGIPPYPETIAYVKTVSDYADQWAGCQ